MNNAAASMPSPPNSSTDSAQLPRDMVSSFRRSTPKSHNGCITCKIRRIKCDEQKPSCERCTSTGRRCDGYAPPRLPVTKQKKKPGRPPKSVAPPEVTPGLVILYTPSVGIQGNAAERRSFQYFTARVNPSDMPWNLEPYFWDNVVLKLSHTYPTVRQSLIALSAIFEDRERIGLGGTPSTNEHVLLHYTKAVKTLVNYLSLHDQDPRVALVSCLIFVWIELLQENLDPGFRHLGGGLNILANLRISGKSDNDVDDIYGPLERSFKRLRVQAAIHGSPSNDFTTSSTRGMETTTPIPEAFSNMLESRVCFDNECNTMFASLRELRECTHNAEELEDSVYQEVYGIQQAHLQRFEQWWAATKRMMANPNNSRDDFQALGIDWLKLYYMVSTLLLQTLLKASEMVFDDYTADFERIVTLCEQIIHEPKAETRPFLSFDMGIILPLFFVIFKCRVLLIRRKALALLRLAPEQEGMWFRDRMLKACEWKVALEEEGRGDLSESSPLPEAARTDEERTVDGGSSKTYITYKRGTAVEIMELPSEMKGVEGIGNIL